jgi:hypothetical protein
VLPVGQKAFKVEICLGRMVTKWPWLDEGAPTKSVHKMKRYTSEGKPITDENKS